MTKRGLLTYDLEVFKSSTSKIAGEVLLMVIIPGVGVIFVVIEVFE